MISKKKLLSHNSPRIYIQKSIYHRSSNIYRREASSIHLNIYVSKKRPRRFGLGEARRVLRVELAVGEAIARRGGRLPALE
jgi:hypothetical protein